MPKRYLTHHYSDGKKVSVAVLPDSNSVIVAEARRNLASTSGYTQRLFNEHLYVNNVYRQLPGSLRAISRRGGEDEYSATLGADLALVRLRIKVKKAIYNRLAQFSASLAKSHQEASTRAQAVYDELSALEAEEEKLSGRPKPTTNLDKIPDAQ